MDSKRTKHLKAFDRLLTIMDELRTNCPWDKKQTFASLRHLTIEETYELCDAIINKDLSALEGEIGDLFLHLVFYCKIGQEKDAFDISSVLNKICEKLIHRHPHVYGDVSVASEEEVKANWEKLKLKEGKKSVLSGVPSALPALVKATRIQEKVKGIGFEWKTAKANGSSSENVPLISTSKVICTPGDVSIVTLETLSNHVGTGLIALPEFQRPQVWNNQERKELVISLCLGVPIGSYLLWEYDADFDDQKDLLIEEFPKSKDCFEDAEEKIEKI